ncbi:MAG TPA: hypothetical protein VKS79_00210 [Gemmataceae bacterium]|nr:hypothetical protein [Gemmataceae bacterium]
MQRRYCKRWFWLSLGVLECLLLAALAACWHHRIGSYRDYTIYSEIRRYRVGDDLWFGKIHAGQDLAELAARHPTQRVEQLGPFTVLTYFTVWPEPPQSIPFEALVIVAKDGRLVSGGAASCTWQKQFFAMSPEDAATLNALYEQKWAIQQCPEP